VISLENAFIKLNVTSKFDAKWIPKFTTRNVNAFQLQLCANARVRERIDAMFTTNLLASRVKWPKIHFVNRRRMPPKNQIANRMTRR